MIAQDVLVHEAVYKLEKFMDQFCDRLHKLGLLRLLRAFPNEFVEIFTYAGSVTVDDVLEAVFVDEEETQMQPGDSITLSLLHEYTRGCDKEGGTMNVMIIILSCLTIMQLWY